MTEAAFALLEIELVCKTCGQSKPVSEFPKGTGRTGVLGICHVCRYGPGKKRETEEGRFCTSCRERKPPSEFGKNKKSKDGIHWTCRSCLNKRSLANHHNRSEDARYLTYKKSELKRKWGLTYEAFEALISSQGNKCAICRAPLIMRSRSTNVDHDHITGAVRGILCMGCNTGLGKFRDDDTLLGAAIEYLRRARGDN